ncbi:MAG: hypothetical protein JWQ79_241 [Mucilaginibacter sp.]|nr:hypothetical protein [Mucilaginibacter sp.]
MSKLSAIFNLKKLKGYADWKLLLFLLLFLNVKLAIKIPAIAIIYLLQFDFKFGFKLKDSRLPLFYLLILFIPFIDLFLNKSYANPHYLLVFLLGISFWLACILAVHQIKLAVERNDTVIIHHTILIFFIINSLVSFFNLAHIVWETGALNPYTYQGQYQKYFISTGDFIKGLTFDTSTTNAILNAFGVIYFLTKKNPVMTLVCMGVLLLTASNFTNVFLLLILAGIFIFNSTRDQKSIIAVCLMFMVLFMGKISPQNNGYVLKTSKIVFYQKNFIDPPPVNPVPIQLRPDSQLNFEERRQKIAILYLDSVSSIAAAKKKAEVQLVLPKNVLKTNTGHIYIPKPDINSAPYQSLNTTPPEQIQLVSFINTHQAELPVSGRPYHFTAMPGKVTGLVQTLNYLKHHPAKIITGAGIGNFSSKLAFRATGLKFTGGYPAKYVYIFPDFMVNHLDIYLNFFSKAAGLHSLTNSPFSVYDQLLAEYGIVGLALLLVFYLGFFAKQYTYLTYGIPLLLMVCAIFFIDYWFEQLSVMVMFELMLFLNIKEGRKLAEHKKLVTQ